MTSDPTRTRARYGWITVLVGSHLARDIAGGAVLALIVTGIPPRLATVLFESETSAIVNAEFPIWAQCAVLAAYAAQLGAETWGVDRDRLVAATVSLCAAGMSAALFWSADPWGGAAWQWVGHFAVQFGVLFVLARRIGHASHGP